MLDLTVYKKYLAVTAIAWAGCLVLLIAAYFIFLKPQINTKQQLESKLREKIQEHKDAEKAAEEQTKVDLKNQIARLRERLEDFVTDFEDAADLNFEVTQIAREKEVASLSVGGSNTKTPTQKVADGNSITEKNIDISFISGFNQFASFVNSLERNKPVIFVHEFELDRSNQNKSAYKVTINARALVRKQHESEIAKLNPVQHYDAKK
jgi:Tfp pilus assembly protein PilO